MKSHVAVWLAPASLLFLVAIGTSLIRISISRRTRQGRPGDRMYDIYVLLFALLLSAGHFCINVVLYIHGRGTDGGSPRPVQDVPLQVAAGLLLLVAVNAIRVSMSLLLLRLQPDRIWSSPLYGVIGIQVCLAIVVIGVQLSICRPLSALWEPTPDAKCIPAGGLLVYAYIVNVANILCDLVLSLLPWTFIHRMRRSRLEKALIACLMSIGLTASVVAIFRMIYGLVLIDKVWTGWDEAKYDILATFECYLLIIAANLPCLKGPTHRLLLTIGVLRENQQGQSLPGFLTHASGGSHFKRQVRGAVTGDDPNVEELTGDGTLTTSTDPHPTPPQGGAAAENA